MVLYVLLFLEAFYFKAGLRAFTIKLIAAQMLFIETFPALFTSVDTTDGSRDLFIADSIIKNAGGIPHQFTKIVWYNFSPLTSISYAIQSLVIHISTLHAEQLVGFVFVLLAVLATGSIALKVTGDVRQSMLCMWVACLIPFAWEYATFPIPEMMAVAMLLLIVRLIMQKETPLSTLASSILVVCIVLTHGGVALELTILAFFIYLLTRESSVLRTSVLALIMFLTYSVYAAVTSTPSGITTILQSIESVTTAIPYSTLHLATNSLEWIAQAASSSFWWVFLGIFAWVGFVEYLNHDGSRQKTYLAFLLISFALFGAGIGYLVQPVASGQEIRYVSLVGYMMLCVPASSGLVILGLRKGGRRLVIPLVIVIFVVATVPNVAVSSDFWHDLGQVNYSGFRMVWTETPSELGSQTYLNAYDTCYVIAANYLPRFVDLNFASDCPSLAAYTVEGNTFLNDYVYQGYVIGGVASVTTNVRPPYVVLISSRLAEFSPFAYGVANPAANAFLILSDIVYSNPSSQAAYIAE
jgi:hypothetical protein